LTDTSETIAILQVAIGPAILVSGVGLLLLTMTNRLARVVDRSRLLAHDLRTERGPDRARSLAQLRILRRRAVLLRRAIELASVSILLAALLVIVLFFTALFASRVGLAVVGALFVACMLSLVAALFAFIADVHQTLAAVDLDIAGIDVGAG
jgi:hypothetical protein